MLEMFITKGLLLHEGGGWSHLAAENFVSLIALEDQQQKEVGREWIAEAIQWQSQEIFYTAVQQVPVKTMRYMWTETIHGNSSNSAIQLTVEI